MDNDIEMYFEGGAGGSVNYLESLIRSQEYILSRLRGPVDTRTEGLKKNDNDELSKLHEVIMAELDLALLGAEKAKSEILKDNAKNNVKPIKGA